MKNWWILTIYVNWEQRWIGFTYNNKALVENDKQTNLNIDGEEEWFFAITLNCNGSYWEVLE